ncbi:DUF3563 family protein [Janthinobacterium aquaticum]|uniref:DUF3563 family protein n=1 Tax=Janthinobacterium sp. FT58W TaxID=2654254 RepID=UPI0012658ED0|nr:DUF3563 family protein [Janthinobacterium sp. FT58W]KAB8042514.1 DUF3563 domain-containing protein [Janthinobacterium sp. FT58W]
MSATTTFSYHTTNSNNIVATLAAVLKRASAYLLQSDDHRERAYEEAYLAESTDRYDLEYRMRELSRSNPHPSWMSGLSR